MLGAKDFKKLKSLGYKEPHKEEFYDENGERCTVTYISNRDKENNNNILKEYEENQAEEVARKTLIDSKIKEMYEEYGNFVWLFYDIGKMLFDGRISNGTITRFLYLCTFANYNPDSYGRYALSFKNNVPIKTRNLQDILNVSDGCLNYFMRECIGNGLIFVDENKSVYISGKYIARGGLDSQCLGNGLNIIRLYSNSFAKLYDKCSVDEHKTLAYLFMLIPFINIHWNVLCFNSKEEDENLINPMTLNDFLVMTGISKSNVSRVAKKLLAIKVEEQFAVSVTIFGHEAYVFVNPKIYYAGNRHDDVMELGKFICPEKSAYSIANRKHKSKPKVETEKQKLKKMLKRAEYKGK